MGEGVPCKLGRRDVWGVPGRWDVGWREMGDGRAVAVTKRKLINFDIQTIGRDILGGRKLVDLSDQ